VIEFEQIESYYPKKLRVFKKNILREYFQYKILEIIYNSSCFNKLIFMGGTALRIIYDNSRFSEDLDFDNIGITFTEFLKLIDIIKKKLTLEGYNIETDVKQRGAFIGLVKVKDVLFNYGFSSHSAQKINLEIDAEPQSFRYTPEQKLLNKFDIFTSIFSVPVDILLSQKIFAILNRSRTMGRDLYDTVFLLGRTKPNVQYLKEKLGLDDLQKIKEALILKTKELNLEKMAEDIKPFIFDKVDANKVKFFKDYLSIL